jgi:DNA-binding NarL/FixJ family response regulator
LVSGVTREVFAFVPISGWPDIVAPQTVTRGAGSALTTRELEILRLLGAGKSNKEIAAQLQISERTARTHVSNILGKLGLTSRTQAALWAVRQGLVEVGPD